MNYPPKSAAMVIRADLLSALDRECNAAAERFDAAIRESEIAEREYKACVDRRTRIMEWIKENAL